MSRRLSTGWYASGRLVSDLVVKAVLAGHPQDISLRPVRHRFLKAFGLTFKMISQIERAKQAATLLEQGVSLLDAAYQAGYADQSPMTRALKHFIGDTPAHIARLGELWGVGFAVHFVQDRAF